MGLSLGSFRFTRSSAAHRHGAHRNRISSTGRSNTRVFIHQSPPNLCNRTADSPSSRPFHSGPGHSSSLIFFFAVMGASFSSRTRCGEWALRPSRIVLTVAGVSDICRAISHTVLPAFHFRPTVASLPRRRGTSSIVSLGIIQAQAFDGDACAFVHAVAPPKISTAPKFSKPFFSSMNEESEE